MQMFHFLICLQNRQDINTGFIKGLTAHLNLIQLRMKLFMSKRKLPVLIILIPALYQVILHCNLAEMCF